MEGLRVGLEIVPLHFDVYWTKRCDFRIQHIITGSQGNNEANLLQINSPRPMQMAMVTLQ